MYLTLDDAFVLSPLLSRVKLRARTFIHGKSHIKSVSPFSRGVDDCVATCCLIIVPNIGLFRVEDLGLQLLKLSGMW